MNYMMKKILWQGKNKLLGITYMIDFKQFSRYAPFCKHLFIKNFTNSKLSTAEITPENEHLLKYKTEFFTKYNNILFIDLPMKQELRKSSQCWCVISLRSHLKQKQQNIWTLFFTAESKYEKKT